MKPLNLNQIINSLDTIEIEDSIFSDVDIEIMLTKDLDYLIIEKLQSLRAEVE
jgi:hypothetical protein